MHSGHPVVVTMFGGGPMVALAAAFIVGRVYPRPSKEANDGNDDIAKE